MRKQLRGTLALLVATVIWGFAFIAQSVGMDLIGPFTFQTVRCALAVLTLIPAAFAMDVGKCSVRQSAEKWRNPHLWKAGIICGYHTMIDWDKTDIDKVTALIEVRVTPQRGKGFDDIAERIYKYPEVNSVYLISGGYDLLVTLEGKSLKEVSRFVSSKLSTLDTVISTATHFILKKYKDHGTIMTRKYEDQREIITP
jgi:DNA-binding Lrp family transcriptional regulator